MGQWFGVIPSPSPLKERETKGVRLINNPHRTTYYEPFVNSSGLKRGEYPRVIPRIGGRMRNKRKA